MKQQEERYYTVKELAEKFGVTTVNIRNLVNNKGLKSFKVGAKIFVSETALKEYTTKLENQRIKRDI